MIRFRFLEGFYPEDLAVLISISKDIPQEYQIDKNVLAGYLWGACDRNAFITLDELVVIWSEPTDEVNFEPADFEDSEARRLCDELGDEYALEIGQGLLGQLWFERNITVVNMGEIVRSATEIVADQWIMENGQGTIKETANSGCNLPMFGLNREIEIGFLTTVLHELRHLQMDTNILLPEEDYPLYLASEKNVEDWCREVFDGSVVPAGLFTGLYVKQSLKEQIEEASLRRLGPDYIDKMASEREIVTVACAQVEQDQR